MFRDVRGCPDDDDFDAAPAVGAAALLRVMTAAVRSPQRAQLWRGCGECVVARHTFQQDQRSGATLDHSLRYK